MKDAHLEPRPIAMELVPQTGKLPPAAARAIQPDFIGDFASDAVGTAVALRETVTVRWSGGNQID